MGLLDLFLPDECCICCRRGTNPCAVCAVQLPEPPDLLAPAALDACTALMAYEDSGAALVRALKFANRRGMVPWLADNLADRFGHLSFDAITWVPCSRAGKRHRGYEPGRLLAEAVGRRTGVPLYALLTRTPKDVGQTGRARHARLQGPKLQLRRALPGPRLLLIDDVSTTGASLSAAGVVLRAAGATYVHGAVVARTP